MTNTLPIRRLGLAVGEGATVDVAWVRVPSQAVARSTQHYTRVAPCRWRYASNGFSADLEVDESGLVVRYSNLWRRVTAPARTA